MSTNTCGTSATSDASDYTLHRLEMLKSKYNSGGIRDSYILLEDIDKEQVKAWINAATFYLTELQRDLSTVAECVHRVQKVEKFEAISIFLEHCRAVITPVRMLPNEILTRIFFETLPSPLHLNFKGLKLMQDQPWKAAQVCSRWRSAAMETPSLWSFVALVVGRSCNISAYPTSSPDQARPSHTLLPLLRECLLRSRNSSLHINLDIRFGTTGRRSLDVIEQVVAVCERWQDVTINMREPNFCYRFLGNIRGRLPRLRRLDWRISSPGSVDAFAEAPNLRSVTLNNTFNGMLPLSQITNLRLTRSVIGGVPGLISVLQQCTELLELRVDPEMTFSQSSEHLIHPGLVYLQCRAELLPAITAPALKFLHATCISILKSKDPQITHITSFLKRSRCSLEKFGLSFRRNEAEEILSALELLPTLTHLEISFQWCSNPYHLRQLLSERLSAVEVSVILVPRLQCLSLYFYPDSFSLECWIPVVESRNLKSIRQRLKTVVVVRQHHCEYNDSSAWDERVRLLGTAVILYRMPSFEPISALL